MLERIVHRWLKVPYTLHSVVVPAKKKPAVTVLFIHGIGNSGRAWDETIQRLPPNIKAITIDLLGFGASPRPPWVVYSAKTQARSVLKTILLLRPKGPIIVVGHSLGALVAVEVAKRYPLLVSSLILCSPPFYRLSESEKRRLPQVDDVLRDIYAAAENNPQAFLKIAAIAMKYKLINNVFTVTQENVASYMGALRSAIINQTSLDDVQKLTMPITIIHGTLDPVVVGSRLRKLAKTRQNISLQTVVASHEVKKRMSKAIVTRLHALTAGYNRER